MHSTCMFVGEVRGRVFEHVEYTASGLRVNLNPIDYAMETAPLLQVRVGVFQPVNHLVQLSCCPSPKLRRIRCLLR